MNKERKQRDVLSMTGVRGSWWLLGFGRRVDGRRTPVGCAVVQGETFLAAVRRARALGINPGPADCQGSLLSDAQLAMYEPRWRDRFITEADLDAVLGAAMPAHLRTRSHLS